jgi:hypothetical protein
MIFYGGTAPGPDADVKGIQFYAYDLVNRKLLYAGPDGPSRYMILARSTGNLYYVPGNSEGELMRFTPKEGGKPERIPNATLGIRAATEETPRHLVYAVSSGQGNSDATLYTLDTRTEVVRKIGPTAVGSQAYVASLDADPTGRYLYYVPGAHGGSERDGTPVVQYDTATDRRKVLAFLHPFYREKYGLTLKGTYSLAVDPGGDKLYITWNTSRGTKAWDCCTLTVIHVPESERPTE